MNKPPAIALLLVAALLTSCASSASDSPSPADNESPAASSTPEATETEPVAQEHTDAELIAALPDSAEEFYGLKIATRCVRMDRTCDGESEPGIAKVESAITGAGSNDGSEEFMSLEVNRDLDRKLQRIVTSDCTPGPYVTEPESLEGGGYAMGERGVNAIQAFEQGGWKGVICTRRFRLLNLDREFASSRLRHVQIVASSSHHTVSAYGAGVTHTPDVVTDYLNRLEGQ